MTNISKLPPAPAMKAPTEQVASRNGVNSILDGAIARQIDEIDATIEQLQNIKTEMLQDHVKAKAIIERHFDILERLREHNDDGRRALERLRADRAELVNAKVAG
jgi:hypothetical protein